MRNVANCRAEGLVRSVRVPCHMDRIAALRQSGTLLDCWRASAGNGEIQHLFPVFRRSVALQGKALRRGRHGQSMSHRRLGGVKFDAFRPAGAGLRGQYAQHGCRLS